MKKHLSLVLCLSLFSTPFMHALTIPQYSHLGIATISTAFGLKKLHESTQEKGTKTQAFLGITCTGYGILALQGLYYSVQKKENPLTQLAINCLKAAGKKLFSS